MSNPLLHIHNQDIDQSATIGPGNDLVVIAGPCVMESREHCHKIAKYLKKMGESLGITVIFKASFDKANRSSVTSFRGLGLEKGQEILLSIQQELGMLTTTDIHQLDEVKPMAKCCDILQIPAFLCRQTDLILKVASSGKAINIKKGQFLSPWDCVNIIDKVKSKNCNQFMLTERGSSFGYNNLVSDMRSIPIMHELGSPVCFDASHSLQLPGGQGQSSGGLRQYIPNLAQAAVAAGADCVFIECHDQPEKALSDSSTVYPLEKLPSLIHRLIQIRRLIQTTSPC